MIQERTLARFETTEDRHIDLFAAVKVMATGGDLGLEVGQPQVARKTGNAVKNAIGLYHKSDVRGLLDDVRSPGYVGHWFRGKNLERPDRSGKGHQVAQTGWTSSWGEQGGPVAEAAQIAFEIRGAARL